LFAYKVNTADTRNPSGTKSAGSRNKKEKIMTDFMGKDGFQWFVGVVEDRQDPKFLGRVRVRCLGYHTVDLIQLPTEDLPWAHPMNPITSATISGVGQTPLGAVEGTWVVGFFQDGAEAQMPIIIGTLPGVPTALPDTESNQGFQDITGNYPKYKEETDVNRLAVNDADNPHSTLTIRKADRDLKVGVANVDATDIVDDPLLADDGGNWDEPETPYAATYPKNHVYETEGGHIREFDDSIGAERIHERHTSGTGYEIGPDGTKITRVKKDNYSLISADEYVHIQGQERHTTDGGLRVKVNNRSVFGNHYNIEVGANANCTVEVTSGDINLVSQQGDVNIKAGKNFNLDVAGNMNVRVQQNAIEEVTGKKDELVIGNNKKTGKRIDLN